jgi:prepilin-type N-terminal cleavage/methylation domain-containing protein
MVHRRHDRGFTLVEILIAIVLVGILAAVVVLGVGSLTGKGSAAACTSSLDASRAAATVHLTSTGSAPTSFTDMVTSGSLQLPSGVTVDSGGRRAVGNGWQLIMQPGNPALFTCDASSTTFVLDQLTTAPAAAFSLRRLSAGYTGPAITVRRSSDNTTADVGFTATGDLDLAALTTFVGANDGFVTRWYDQSGNGRHKSQGNTARQPRIVTAGVVETMSGKPTVRHDAGVGLVAPTGAYLTNASAASVNLVAASTSSSTVFRRALGSPDINWLLGPYQNLNGFHSVNWNNLTGPAWSQTQVEVFTVIQAPTNTSWRNGLSVTTSNNKGAISRLGTGIEGQYGEAMLGVISEFVEVNGILSTADRQLLERNQGTYFGVTVA